jgi:hypothetical protein
MDDDALPYEIQADEGIAVELPSGATYYVHTDGEAHYLRDKIRRYLSDNHFVNISDMQEIDRMITFELLIHRWSMWLARGKDYWNDPINTKQYSDMVQDYSREVRQLKKGLGVDKSSRDRTRGDDSVAALWDNLLRRAREFGYTRNEQMIQVITSFHRIKAMITLHKNCFSGDTEILTKKGVRKLSDVAGTAVDVLDGNGGWATAMICRYEPQELWRIELTRSGRSKTIDATAGHRWFVHKRTSHGTRTEPNTVGLRPGDRLVSLIGKAHKKVPDWKVVSVRPTGRIEPVFCPDVPTTHSFVLEGNILTGNTDEIERKENACELSDVLEVIEEEIAKFDAIDESFRFEKQALWIRSQ